MGTAGICRDSRLSKGLSRKPGVAWSSLGLHSVLKRSHMVRVILWSIGQHQIGRNQLCFLLSCSFHPPPSVWESLIARS